jgi:hypothetical protein
MQIPLGGCNQHSLSRDQASHRSAPAALPQAALGGGLVYRTVQPVWRRFFEVAAIRQQDIAQTIPAGRTAVPNCDGSALDRGNDPS